MKRSENGDQRPGRRKQQLEVKNHEERRIKTRRAAIGLMLRVPEGRELRHPCPERPEKGE